VCAIWRTDHTAQVADRGGLPAVAAAAAAAAAGPVLPNAPLGDEAAAAAAADLGEDLGEFWFRTGECLVCGAPLPQRHGVTGCDSV
jgi:hypothetical protein